MAIDWSTLTDPLQAINLIFKKEDPRDVYQKNNIFQAVVLTPGYTMTQQEAKALQSSFKRTEDDDEEGKRDEKKYFARVYFKGRILGPNSPHSFLPNPCDLATAENSDAASRAIALHTTFVSTKDYDKDDMPQPNDIFTVSLRGGDDDTPFNLQVGDALYRTSAPKRRSKKEAEKCETIAGMFQNMTSVGDGDTRDTSYPPCENEKGVWTSTPITELAKIIYQVVGSNKDLGVTILTVAINEQPEGDSVGGWNFNHYGIMADLGDGSWGSPGDEHIKCAVVSEEGGAGEGYRMEQFRWFAAYEDDTAGVKFMRDTLNNKGWSSATGKEWCEDYWHLWGGMTRGGDDWTDRVNGHVAGQTANYNKAASVWDSLGFGGGPADVSVAVLE